MTLPTSLPSDLSVERLAELPPADAHRRQPARETLVAGVALAPFYAIDVVAMQVCRKAEIFLGQIAFLSKAPEHGAECLAVGLVCAAHT